MNILGLVLYGIRRKLYQSRVENLAKTDKRIKELEDEERNLSGRLRDLETDEFEDSGLDGVDDFSRRDPKDLYDLQDWYASTISRLNRLRGRREYLLRVTGESPHANQTTN